MIKKKKALNALTADRDSADKQAANLLHCRTELTLLCAAITECGCKEQVTRVFDRMAETLE